MLDWRVVIAVLVLVILVVYLIVNRRYRGQIASRDAENAALLAANAALLAALNERDRRDIASASMLGTGLFLLVVFGALAVLLLFVPGTPQPTEATRPTEPEATRPTEPPRTATTVTPATATTPTTEQQQGALSPRQERWKASIAGALQQLRPIMENLRLRFNEVTTATTTATTREKPIVREHRRYYRCCCPPYDYYRGYYW